MDCIEMLGGRLTVAARMGEGDGDAVLVRSAMPPGRLIPLHSHADPECFLVLAGALAVWFDGAWHAVGEGESLRVPDGAPHAVRAEGAADVLVMTNGRLLRFFREAGHAVAPDAPPAPLDIPRVVAAAQRFGYWLATPEEHARTTA